MGSEPVFAADLYQGTAGYYDRYRLPYPRAMTEYVAGQAGISGRGRLLDLACGTGQLTFPLRRHFAEAWAVDREPDMVEAVRVKAAAMGAGNVRPVRADAETLDAEPEYFELAVIGNAFHRLRRDAGRRTAAQLAQAGRVRGAVLGDTARRRAMGSGSGRSRTLLGRWRRALGAAGRVPANWAEPRRQRPDEQVLSEAGFELAGRREFTV